MDFEKKTCKLDSVPCAPLWCQHYINVCMYRLLLYKNFVAGRIMSNFGATHVWGANRKGNFDYHQARKCHIANIYFNQSPFKIWFLIFNFWLISIRDSLEDRPLMISDFRGGGVYKSPPKLAGKNQTFGSEIVENWRLDQNKVQKLRLMTCQAATFFWCPT